MSFSTLRLACTASVLALVMAANAVAPAMAQDAAPAAAAPAAAAAAPTPETVVASVGGENITEADLGFAAEDLTQELGQMPPEERKPFLLRVLIDMKVMAKAGEDAGMANTPLFQQRLDYLRDRSLRRAFFADTIAKSVTEEAVRADYDKFIADFKPTEEIRASHILVATEEEAKAIKAELDGGADFATLAKEKSIDPGAANGGDLGFFGKGMMVAPFEAAAYALTDIGQVSEPVQSQFGWHIIKLEEKRESKPPTFEQVNLETLGAGIDDSLYGFRVYPVADLVAVMARQPWMRRFDFDTEAVVRLAWRGVKPVNLAAPVKYLSAEEGGVSHFRYGRDNLLLSWMHLRLMLECVLRLPLLLWRRATRRPPFQE